MNKTPSVKTQKQLDYPAWRESFSAHGQSMGRTLPDIRDRCGGEYPCDHDLSRTEATSDWFDHQLQTLPTLEPVSYGEECVVCGKDSWTCEHYEEWKRDSDGPLCDYETEAERNA